MANDSELFSGAFARAADEQVNVDFTDFLVDGAAFTAVNTDGKNGATVSPEQLFLDHAASAPNSNSFTNLTTPSMGGDYSPDDLDSFETSPMFDGDDLNGGNWASLFTDVSTAPAQSSEAAAMSRIASTSSADFQLSLSQGHRMSLTSGVAKNRRTGKPLGHIEVDVSDTKAFKRAKNTLAARKSRQKKRDIEETLRIELANMTAERDRWMHEAIARGAAIPESPIAISPR